MNIESTLLIGLQILIKKKKCKWIIVNYKIAFTESLMQPIMLMCNSETKYVCLHHHVLVMCLIKK